MSGSASGARALDPSPPLSVADGVEESSRLLSRTVISDESSPPRNVIGGEKDDAAQVEFEAELTNNCRATSQNQRILMSSSFMALGLVVKRALLPHTLSALSLSPPANL